MIDDDVVQTVDPVIDLPPEIDPQPDPDPVQTDPPMEVIPVDDFFDRLAELLGEGEEDSDSEALEDPEDPEEAEELEEAIEAVDADVDLPVPVPDSDPVIGITKEIVGHLLDMIVDLGKIEKNTETIAQTLDHPALTTSFEDYTVSEALLLLLLLFAFVSACARMLRGGLRWLRS